MQYPCQHVIGRPYFSPHPLSSAWTSQGHRRSSSVSSTTQLVTTTDEASAATASPLVTVPKRMNLLNHLTNEDRVGALRRKLEVAPIVNDRLIALTETHVTLAEKLPH